jgi:hypothetical protein
MSEARLPGTAPPGGPTGWPHRRCSIVDIVIVSLIGGD